MFYLGKIRCIRVKWLISGKVFVFGKNGGIWAKMVLFRHIKLVDGKSWLYYCKVVVFGQKWLHSGTLVLIGQSSCILAKWLYSGKVVTIG